MTGSDENNFSGHVYELKTGEPKQQCANCKHTSACTLPAFSANQGCIYYDADSQFAVDEIIRGFEDSLARSLKDLSTELGKHGMAVSEVDFIQHDHVAYSMRGNEIAAQIYKVEITTKTKRAKG